MNQNSNEQILMEAILDDFKKNISGNLKASEVFELFSAEQILKDNNLAFTEIEEGIVDGSLDGGIDSFYIFADGEIVDNIEHLENARKNIKIEIWVIQSKTSLSFEANAIDKLIVTIDQIFNFSKLEDLVNELNPRLLEKAKLFKEVYKKTATKFPELHIKYCYATRGQTLNIHQSVKIKEELLLEKTRDLFSTAKAKIEFIYYGVNELLELYRKEKSYTLTLKLSENPIVSKEGYLALVKLSDYFNFITDEDNQLRKYIFDLNVRDYQGSVEVNKDIENSLLNDSNINFWVLNNGVTIIADKGSAVAKDLTLENVQIVNGLQTSTSIYNYLQKVGIGNENRSILAKIIVKDEPEVIDKVIKASNFQTPIAISSLKATDLFQREIEDYFKKNDLFYDRRKGYYKNTGKSPDKIISIAFLAQAIISILHKEPDFARARPSSLLKKESDYQKVFNKNAPLPIYLFCARHAIQVQSFLRNDFGNDINIIKLNFKFHISYVSVALALNKSRYYLPDLLTFKDKIISNDLIDEATKWLCVKVNEFKDVNRITLDAIAKSSQFKEHLVDRLNREYFN
jgi:hypothetical protein